MVSRDHPAANDSGTTSRADPLARAMDGQTPLRPRTIGRLVYWLVLSIIVPVGFFAVLILLHMTQAENQRAEDVALSSAVSLSKDLEREIKAIRSTLSALSTSQALQSGEFKAFHRQATDVSTLLGLAILLREPSGQQLINTRVPYGTPLPASVLPEAERKLYEEGRPYVSGLIMGAVAKRLVVAIGVPVTVAGRPRYSLVASLELERIAAIVRDQTSPSDLSFAITDASGAIIASEGNKGLSVSTWPLGPAAVGTLRGVDYVAGLDGQQVLRAHVSLPLGGWVVSAYRPVATLNAPLRNSWASFFGLGALALLLALPLTLLFARRISGSIRKVSFVAADLERGEPLRSVQTGVVEIDEVAQALVTASFALRERARLLAESVARFRSTFDQAAVGFEQIDLKGRWVYCNNRFCEMIGYSSAECDKLLPIDIVHPDDVPHEQEQREALLRGTASAYRSEKRYFKKDKSVMHARVTTSLVRDEDGEPLYFVTVVEDITAGLKAQAARARLAALVESSHDAIASVSLDGVIETWNPGAEHLFGYTSDAICGRRITALAATDQHAPVEAMLKDGLKGQASRRDAVFQREDGASIDVAISLSPIFEKGQDVAAFSVTIEDVRDRRLWERQLILLNRELQHRVKNSLAVVQSIANQTLRSSPSPQTFHRAFLGRLQALAAANDLLLQTSWTGGDLETIIDGQILPLLSAPSEQLQKSGPAVALSAELTVPIALAMHELATNALKYGALSVAGGSIFIEWRVATAPRKLLLAWTERGGPRTRSPVSTGFGSTLIKRGIPSATVSQVYGDDGMRCMIDLPLTEAGSYVPAAVT